MYEPPKTKTAKEMADENARLNAYARKCIAEKVTGVVQEWANLPNEEITDSLAIKDIVQPSCITDMLDECSDMTNLPLSQKDLRNLGIIADKKKVAFFFTVITYSIPRSTTLGDVISTYQNKLD